MIIVKSTLLLSSPTVVVPVQSSDFSSFFSSLEFDFLSIITVLFVKFVVPFFVIL